MKQVLASRRSQVLGGVGAVFALAAAAAGDSVVYVDDDAQAGGNGAGWASAYRFLQDAITSAQPGPNETVVIRVAQGTYYPDQSEVSPNGTGNRLAAFALKNRVVIEGGYAGLPAVDPDARDIAAFVTTLSGDLAGDDQPGFVNFDENSYMVVKAVNVDESATLDGVTVREANPHAHSQLNVGAVDASFSEFTMTHCTVTENVGWGMFLHYSEPLVEQCVFSQNTEVGVWAALGAAVFQHCSFLNNSNGGVNLDDCNPIFADCVFEGNSGYSGGGLDANHGAHPTLTDCVFHANAVTAYGGAMDIDEGHVNAVRCTFDSNTAAKSGGAVYSIFASASTFTDCVFTNNSSNSYGGAVADYKSIDPASFLACTFQSNSAKRGGAIYGPAILTNCLLSDNTATERGGAMLAWFHPSTITNCTIVQNHAPLGPAVFAASSGKVKIANSIVRGHGGHPFDGPGSVTAKYSNVFPAMPGTGNITASPKFVNTGGGDFRLKPGSPCIDAGKNSLTPAGVLLDLLGYARFINDPATPDSGSGSPPVVDIGAYEFQAE